MTTLERAIKAAWDAREALLPERTRMPFDGCPEPARTYTGIMVVAALKAIREPDEGMLAAAKPEPFHLYGVGNRGDEYQAQMKAAVAVERAVVRQEWQAMIDHIITEGEGTSGKG